MAHNDRNWTIKYSSAVILLFAFLLSSTISTVQSEDKLLTACQHLRRVESRRAKALNADPELSAQHRVRVPKCSRMGEFEPIQCSNDVTSSECWCVDEYGIEIVGSRAANAAEVNCTAIQNDCPASSCRMYCPSGFARDARSGCSICQCRDPCEGVKCPGSLSCQPQEVRCATDPCPPVPTCKRARSLEEFCPVGQPLSITGTQRPFLCGTDPGKPNCPPLFKCLVQTGNDYGVCCPASLKIQKPGQCPSVDTQETSAQAGVMCGAPCTHDLECSQMQKCCQTAGCAMNCRQPFNVTACHQARMLSEILSVNEREGRGYIPQCDENNIEGPFTRRQCSRNGLVCWCVNPMTGDKIKGTMGAASLVDCEGVENAIGRSMGRSVDGASAAQQLGCDQNICAAVCEYGFKNDHNGCPTCECSDPCEGYQCPMGSRCDVAKDPECVSGSSLCASEPVCKPDVAYSNPCEVGTPFSDNSTGEVFYCRLDSIDDDEFQSKSFFNAEEEVSGRSSTNFVACPRDYKCKKLHGENKNVCCPQPTVARSNKQTEPLDYDEAQMVQEINEERQQTMCEYLRDFADRMEGTEEGMTLALPSPTCDNNGNYNPRQCKVKKVMVTQTEQKRLLEEKNVRQMRSLVANSRTKRSGNNQPDMRIELVPLEQANESLRSLQDLNIRNLVEFLRKKILDPVANREELTFADMILSRDNGESEGRMAKVIDFTRPKSQSLGGGAGDNGLFEKPLKRQFNSAADQKKKDIPEDPNQLVEVEVETCWCVDSFGTEIPKSSGMNVTDEFCMKMRNELDCLDITCRMGCDYGFSLDPETRCPRCQCRDPCDNVECADNHECRSVDVSCDGEYCPPVPACLPRKPGQCPFLIPPGNEESDLDACDYECRSDAHCEGSKRCCSNGCGTQCVEPQLKTACQHLQSIQVHQAIELGVPARRKYIAQCDENTGSWRPIQCGPTNECWCVDEFGIEKMGTRTNETLTPDCNVQPKVECPMRKCQSMCEHGYLFDENGCRTCTCRDPCLDITCPNGEKCELVQVECIDLPCPQMPICLPVMESTCVVGEPLQLNGKDVSCGPQNDADSCPSTHACQISPMNNRGVCCSKQRDVCFETLENSCVNKTLIGAQSVIGKWTFNARSNKCVPVKVTSACSSKNLFHTETACRGVCPVLSKCERLRMKNELAARRSRQSSQSWFHPQCDPETGNWLSVQCLGTTADASSDQTKMTGVCWCADKKGAPLKGSLTRNTEPICNHRQARRRMNPDTDLQDPVMEELIRQMTIMVDDNLITSGDDLAAEEFDFLESESIPRHAGSTGVEGEEEEEEEDWRGVSSTAQEENQVKPEMTLMVNTTRCQSLKKAASFQVACDEYGGFLPLQCNGDLCWCVDAAGNQLAMSSTFPRGTKTCRYTPIDRVSIELYIINLENDKFPNIYEIVQDELTELFKETPENLSVDEMHNHILIKFDLTGATKIDDSFALEEMMKQNSLVLIDGRLRPDFRLSRFLYKEGVAFTEEDLQHQGRQSSSAFPESAFQTIVFVLATGSAFLVSIFVIFVMLKRGRGGVGQKDKNMSTTGYEYGDKHLDFNAPIFVLSPPPTQHQQQQQQQQQQPDK